MVSILVRVCVCVFLLAMSVTASAASSNKKRAMLDKERNSTEYACKDNLKIFYLALTNYSELNNGKLPVKNQFFPVIGQRNLDFSLE